MKQQSVGNKRVNFIKRTRKNNQTDIPTKDAKLYFGFDNGVTGTIGAIWGNKTWFFEFPVKKEQNYTKKKGNITRVIYSDLLYKLAEVIVECDLPPMMCLIERPMVNPGRFAATISAVRALETTLNVIEVLKIPYQYEDSKKWQKELLPNGSVKEQLKVDSKTIGCRLFPQHSELITKHKDADGILMAEYCRRKF